MGTSASTGKLYPKKIQHGSRGSRSPNISGRITSNKFVVYEDDLVHNNYRGHSRNSNHYPEKITFVKNSSNIPSSTRFDMGPVHEAQQIEPPYSYPEPLREGEIVLVHEPGSQELRRMRLVSGPAQHPTHIPYYDPPSPPIREQQNQIIYYNTPRVDPRTTYNREANVDEQNLIYRYTPPLRHDRLLAYNAPFQSIERLETNRFNAYEDHHKHIRETQFMNGEGLRVNSAYRGLRIPSVSSRRSSTASQMMMKSTQLEVETLEKFHGPDGKLYKIVKPIEERSRYSYRKPYENEKLFFIESSRQETNRLVTPKPVLSQLYIEETLEEDHIIRSTPESPKERERFRESSPEYEPEPIPKPKTELVPEPEIEPEPKSVLEPEPKRDPKPEQEPDPESDRERDPKRDQEPSPETEPESKQEQIK